MAKNNWLIPKCIEARFSIQKKENITLEVLAFLDPPPEEIMAEWVWRHVTHIGMPDEK